MRGVEVRRGGVATRVWKQCYLTERRTFAASSSSHRPHGVAACGRHCREGDAGIHALGAGPGIGVRLGGRVSLQTVLQELILYVRT